MRCATAGRPSHRPRDAASLNSKTKLQVNQHDQCHQAPTCAMPAMHDRYFARQYLHIHTCKRELVTTMRENGGLDLIPHPLALVKTAIGMDGYSNVKAIVAQGSPSTDLQGNNCRRLFPSASDDSCQRPVRTESSCTSVFLKGCM